MKDAYRRYAGVYDRLFEGMNKGLRLAGVRMFRPSKGMRILDVGCGTGTHLALYQRYGCELHGIDRSPSMLAVARTRLGESARLAEGDATSLPYDDTWFDLVICMLTLHEMAQQTRLAALNEMRRVLKGSGHILLIDFHPGPYQPLQGWTSKTIIFFSELAAGGEHFRNHRQFLATQGLPGLSSLGGLVVEKQSILAGGTFAVVLAGCRKSQPAPA